MRILEYNKKRLNYKKELVGNIYERNETQKLPVEENPNCFRTNSAQKF